MLFLIALTTYFFLASHIMVGGAISFYFTIFSITTPTTVV
jgi:hypothetical protein